MASDQRLFDYVALDPTGRRVRGSLAARTDGVAFEQLKRQGLAPLRIHPSRGNAAQKTKAQGLSDREAAEFLADLAALMQAGSSMRTALSVVGAKSDRASVRGLCKDLTTDISAGMALDQAFARHLGRRQAFIPALVSASEAAGDLAGGLQRAAEMLGSQVRLRDQLVSVLSYPAFVLATSMLALGIILFLVIPSLAPLVEQNDVTPPLMMRILIAMSRGLRENGVVIAGGFVAVVVGLVVAGRAGLLSQALDRLALSGPFKRTAGALVFGAFAISLGNMLAAGAPMADALRLAVRSVRSDLARKRIEPAAHAVRQGRSLSDVLARVDGFPQSIVRLAAIGEASGALGTMMARAGKLEEDSALRRIETIGRLIGPTLIIVLGGLIGLLMGGLLSGVTHLGDAALQ